LAEVLKTFLKPQNVGNRLRIPTHEDERIVLVYFTKKWLSDFGDLYFENGNLSKGAFALIALFGELCRYNKRRLSYVLSAHAFGEGKCEKMFGVTPLAVWAPLTQAHGQNQQLAKGVENSRPDRVKSTVRDG